MRVARPRPLRCDRAFLGVFMLCLSAGSIPARSFSPPLFTCRRGWFPSSYTKLLEENEETVSVPGPR